MGGSSSSSKKETNITTTTETTMGDIGLTGQNAIDMAAIMQTGAIEQTRISAASLDNLMQTVGKTSQQLIGGASDMIRTQGDIAKAGTQGGGDLVKIAPWLAVAAILTLPILIKKRKR